MGILAAAFGAAAWASTPLEPDPCAQDTHPAVQKLREFAAKRSFHWDKSEIQIAGKPLGDERPTIERARAAMAAALAPDGRLVSAFQRETGLGTDLQDPKFWDLYMRSYDLLGFSAGYVDLTFRVSRRLPEEGDVLDLGGGTGNFPAVFLHEHPKLRATLVDKQGVGLAIAEEKRKAFGYGADRWRIVPGDVTDGAVYGNGPYAAVVLNNVLYTLPPGQKLRVLELAKAVVPTGAPILVGEPVPQDLRGTIAFFDKNLVSAIENGAPFTDHSLLAMLAVNVIILKGAAGTRYFQEPEDVLALGRAAGLALDGWEPSYFGGAGFYAFRKK